MTAFSSSAFSVRGFSPTAFDFGLSGDPRFELDDEPAREFALRGRQAAPVDWGARHFAAGRRKRTFEVSE